jgi:pimeloyl-ACP methyl ester carboxylesterase
MKRIGLAMCITVLGGLLWGAEPFDVAVPGDSEKDDLILQGDYTAPASSSSLVLVCLHGLGSSRGEWEPLIRQAAKRGWGSLAYDLRGHGNSRGTMAGNTVNYEDPENGRDPEFWKLFPSDLGDVLSSLEKKTGEGPNRVVVAGASLGANVAVTYAAQRPGLRAVVLLSPGLDYAGLQTEGPAMILETPALLVAAQPDLYAFMSGERLITLAPKNLVTWWPLPKGTTQGAHGTQLFDGKLEIKILDWIAKTAGPR